MQYPQTCSKVIIYECCSRDQQSLPDGPQCQWSNNFGNFATGFTLNKCSCESAIRTVHTRNCYCDTYTPSKSQTIPSVFITSTPTYAHRPPTTSPATTNTMTSATMMDSSPYSISSTSNLVTASIRTSAVVPVIAGVLPVCLLLLLLTMICSILVCTLYRRKAKHITGRPQIVTQGQLK